MIESFECIVISVSLSKVRINKYFFMITKTGEVRGAKVSTPGSHQGRSRLVSRHVRIRNISSSSKDREELAIWVSSSAVSG